ncbi:MAG TPA: DUF916 domain-containing protein [Frankiaceae bacterium]|nr:DUF916 domain-containing protein [Frankiaceae bacterium]
MNRSIQRLTIGAVAVLVALSTDLGVSMAASSPPAAAVGGGISLRPATPNPASPSYFTITAKAGTTVQESVVVTNNASAPVDLIVSPVDGLTGQTSGSVYANRQDPVRKAGKWVTPSLTSLQLPGNSQRAVGFTVTIPAGTSAGDHLAGVAVENTQPTTSSNGFAIKQILRNVIGVLVVVPGSAAFVPQLSSLGIQQVGATGIGAVDVGLSNAGTMLAKPKLTVALVDTANSAAYHRTLTRNLDTVLPGDTIKYPFTWPDLLKKGHYAITATLTGGGKSVTMHSTFQLGTVLAGVNQPLPKASAQAKKSGLPMGELIAIVLGAALVFGVTTGVVVSRGRKRASSVRQL